MSENLIERMHRSSVSLSEGKCGCWRCMSGRNEVRVRMIVCPVCGCKRCPKASDHELTCTGSNEPGQSGSVYA